MKIICCVDDNLGMIFNNRRQSQDRVLRKLILELCEGNVLRMNNYSAQQFETLPDNIIVSDTFLDDATEDDFCFVENIDMTSYKKNITMIYLYNWNRLYPADMFFNIPLLGYKLISSTDFKGYSHDKITEMVYSK